MNKPPFVRPPIVQTLDLDDIAPGRIERRRVVMTENATGNETLVPVVVLRAAERQPIVGITAVMHGNELNGIQVIHRLVQQLADLTLQRGTVIAVPIVNIPGYLQQQREFEDGQDLNRIMPGAETGDESQLYAHRFLDRIARHFEYLIDLHTASFGRANSLYVRADMSLPTTARLARLLSPQIIVHSRAGDGTLRGTLEARGVHAVTVEVGDPQRFQQGLVRSARLGILEVLEHLEMIGDVSDPEAQTMVECSRSYWMYTDRGGILSVLPGVTEPVKQGEVIARLRNVWGDVVREYEAPDDGVVIGKSTNPAARAGSRILHIGIVA